MNESSRWYAKGFGGRKTVLILIIAAVLVTTSAVTAIAVAGMTSSNNSANPDLQILNVSHDPEEAYVNELVEWAVLVSVKEYGQQGKGLLFTWNWDDGNITVSELKSVSAYSTGMDVETHAWTEPGIYNVTVSVWDGYGSEQNVYHNVSAEVSFAVKPLEINTPPSPRFDVTPQEGTVDTIFFFNASSTSDLEDDPQSLMVRWDWESDGEWDTEYTTDKMAEHQYSSARAYFALMEVMDSGGLVNQTCREVVVTDSTSLTPHDPIIIDGDKDFLPENGVIAGTGSDEDPYVIGGWIITVGEGTAIDIQNTNSHFMIIDSELVGDVNISMQGIHMEDVGFALLERVKISGFTHGVFARTVGTLTVRSCQIEWNADGIIVVGGENLDFYNNDVSYNHVGLGNHEGIDINDGVSVSVSHNILKGNANGVRLYSCDSAMVFNNTITDSSFGMQIIISEAVVMFNTVRVTHGGIIIWGCSNSIISVNDLMCTYPSSSLFGIEYTTCTDLAISYNKVSMFRYGIGTHYAYDPPIHSERVGVLWNEISESIGSGMRIYYVSDLSIIGNSICCNLIGLDIDSTATYLRVHYNDFIDNDIQVMEDEFCVGNVWDDGYPDGGNFWSDYSGIDNCSGADQSEPGADGIGDTPYVLLSGSQDNYPFMEPLNSGFPDLGPTASFTVSPEIGTIETLFEFDASACWDDNDPIELLEVRWDWEGNGQWDTNWSTNKLATHVFGVLGTFMVVLEVRDSGGLTDQASRTVLVTTSTGTIPHDPIHIDGDLDFVATAAAESWAGNGTEDDPYVIELLEITGAGVGYAIMVENTAVHFVVQNCQFSEASLPAIYFVNVVHASVHHNLFTSCPLYSIYCEQSESLSIQSNTVIGGSHCIGLIRCEDAYIANNTVEDAEWYPLCIESSYDVTLRENRFDGAGIKLGGYLVSHWNDHDIDDSNTVNGEPVYYIKDRDGGSVVPSEAGQIILANCTGMIVECDSKGGISLGFSPDNTITGSVVSSSVHWGIYISYSPRTTVMSTSVYGCDYGVFVLNSPDCVIEDSIISDCDYGMYSQQSDRVSVLYNSILESDSCGILLFFSSFWEIRHNLIAGGLQEGINLVGANSNIIVSNDFIDNMVHATGAESIGNVWDDGYPSGGNFWSDYQGVDEYSGENQTEPGSDGIGDTPYVLEFGGQDNYPLMTASNSSEPMNTKPVADFTVYPQSGTVGTTFEFDASSSWDLEDPVSDLEVRWDWENDGVWDSNWTDDMFATHVFGAVGTYEVILEVRDSGGLTDSTNRSVIIKEPSGDLEPKSYDLSFVTTDAIFDPVRPYVYITDKYAMKLYFVNLTTGCVDKTFEFSYMTESLAMTPDGSRLYVALLTREHDACWWDWEGHVGYIASIDLSTQVKDREYMINEDPGDILATSNGHLVVGSGSGQWTYIRVFDAIDGTEISGVGGFRQYSRLALHPSESIVYAADVDSYPSDICRYDLKSNGAISYASDSPYHGDYRMSGNVWTSPLGDELVTRGGDVFTAGMQIESDMRYITSMTPIGSLINGLCYDTVTRIIFTGEGNAMRYYSMDNHLYLGEMTMSLPVNFVNVYDDIVGMLLRGTETTSIQLILHPLTGGPNNTYPVADFTATPANGSTLTDFFFNASSSHDEQDSVDDLEFRWDLDGDGVWDTTYSSDSTIVKRYDVAGIYNVKLEVRDTLGWADDMVSTVTVVFEPDPGYSGPAHDPFMLPYTVTDAAFDPIRPYMYVSSKYANKVYFVNLESGLTEKQFDFTHMTESLTITPDGSRMYAALLIGEHSPYWFDGHAGEIACFDLATGVKDGQFRINEDPYDIVVTSNGHLVVSSGSGQWDQIRVYDTIDGAELGSALIRHMSRLSMHPSESIIYAADTDVSPSDIERFDLSPSGSITAIGDSPYHGDYSMGGNVWVNPLGDSLVVRGGHAFTAGMPIQDDMHYLTTVTGTAITSAAFDVANGAMFTLEGSYLRWYDLDSYYSLGSTSTTVTMEFLGLNGSCVYCLDVQTSGTQISVLDNPMV